MKTWQQTPIRATPLITTLALTTALAFGGLGGYAMRSLAESPATLQESSPTETRRNVNPGIGMRRAEPQDITPDAGFRDGPILGPVGANNPGIGQHRLDREELP